MQTSYAINPNAAFEGMLADLGVKNMASGVNPNVAIFIGKFCVRDTNDGEIKHPAAITDLQDKKLFVGVAAHHHALESQSDGLAANYPVNSLCNVLRQGQIWVVPEEAVTPDSKVYVRYATGIIDSTKTQKGSFRASPDGTAQVATLTPTAVDATEYQVGIFDKNGALVKSGSFTSGVSSTATTIVTGLKAALGTVPGITLSGTTTLIITAAVLGEGFTVQFSGTMALAATTPNTQSAYEIVEAKYLGTAAAGVPVQLQIRL
jgi:hypothetical protein